MLKGGKMMNYQWFITRINGRAIPFLDEQKWHAHNGY